MIIAFILLPLKVKIPDFCCGGNAITPFIIRTVVICLFLHIPTSAPCGASLRSVLLAASLSFGEILLQYIPLIENEWSSMLRFKVIET